jgi:hypothetical protein
LYEFLFEFNEELCFASWFDVVRFSFSYGVLDLRNSIASLLSFCAPLSAAVALPSHVFPLRSSVLSMLLWFSSLGSQQFKLVLGLAPCVILCVLGCQILSRVRLDSPAAAIFLLWVLNPRTGLVPRPASFLGRHFLVFFPI